MFVSSLTSLIAQLAAVKAAVLDTSVPAHTVCHLAQGAFSPTPASDPTTFTEATYTGYADQMITAWTPAYLVNNLVAEITAASILFFQPTGTALTNLVTGYWLVGANGDYIGGEAFSTPIPMGSPSNALSLIPKWQIPLANWSGELVP